jgi:hypothetical protein
MLALEMGLGKTLCVIAAHALEQHLVPEAELQTDLTAEGMEECEEVLVGVRHQNPEEDNLKPANLYRGFKQLQDGKGTIAPDGSVRPLALRPSRLIRSSCGLVC